MLRIIDDRFLSNLRVLASAGELARQIWLKKVNNKCSFYNAYGPTESSICATISRCKIGDSNITLGAPLKNVITYVLKDNFKEAAAGEFGIFNI